MYLWETQTFKWQSKSNIHISQAIAIPICFAFFPCMQALHLCSHIFQFSFFVNSDFLFHLEIRKKSNFLEQRWSIQMILTLGKGEQDYRRLKPGISSLMENSGILIIQNQNKLFQNFPQNRNWKNTLKTTLSKNVETHFCLDILVLLILHYFSYFIDFILPEITTHYLMSLN